MGFDRVVHHVEDDASLNLLILQRAIARVSHADRCGINDYVECNLPNVGAFNAMCLRLPSQFLRLSSGSIENPHFRSTFFETEHRGPSCASRSQNEDLCFVNRETLLEGTNYACDIRIETVKFTVLSAYNRIARTCLCCVRVGVIQIFDDRLLVGHGHADAGERNLTYALEQLLELLGVKWKINAVHVCPAHRGIHYYRGERMLHGIAGDPVNTGGRIYLLNTINSAEIACCHLARCGLEIGANRPKREDAPRSNAQS